MKSWTAQCRENIEAHLDFYKLGPILEVVEERPDRLFCLMPPDFEERLKAACFSRRLFEMPESLQKLHGPTALYSYQENHLKSSLQATKHSDGRWEFDHDRRNPNSILGLPGHIGEVLRPGLTDPFAVRKELMAYGIIPELT
jgi:hypothetical protein